MAHSRTIPAPSRARRAAAVLGAAAWLCAAPALATDVALLKSADAPAWKPAIDAFRKAAPTVTVTEYDLKSDRAEAERVLGTLKGKPVILVAFGELAAQAAHAATPELPLVFAMVPDPAKAGLVGVPNTAGVAFSIPVKNQLAAFRMVNPRGVRVGVVYTEANLAKMIEDATKAASLVRIQLVAKPVASEKDVPAVLKGMLTGSEPVDAVWIPPDPSLRSDSIRYILNECLSAGKPVYSFTAQLVQEGALVSNGPNVASVGEQVAELVTRMTAADKKLDMLVPRAELVINKKIADKLKVDIPADALKAADNVIK